MSRTLVLVHGRAQERKDPDVLKAEWLRAWETGLRESRLTIPIPESDIHFPYYGDTLDALHRGSAEVPDVLVRGSDGSDDQDRQLAFVGEVLQEILTAQGIPEEQVLAVAAEAAPAAAVERGPQNWRWVRAITTVLDRVPGLSGAAVAMATADVWNYLQRPTTRTTIDDGVRAALPPDAEAVVVGHSLGSVITYNLLRADGAFGRWTVPLFVTLGSPLGVQAIRRLVGPTTFPSCADGWFNAMDPDDIVALHPLSAPFFNINPKINNKTDVRNTTPNQHGIAGYLSDPEVAKRIHDALVAS